MENEPEIGLIEFGLDPEAEEEGQALQADNTPDISMDPIFDTTQGFSVPQITAFNLLKATEFKPEEPRGPPVMKIAGADCGQPNCICGSTIDDLHFCEMPEDFEVNQPSKPKCCKKHKSDNRTPVSNFNQDL